jgi:hypothetical protein
MNLSRHCQGTNVQVGNQTEGHSEANLESLAMEALRRIFPLLPKEALRSQVTFTIQLGHGVFNIDGEQSYRTTGRADVLVYAGSTPLAVLEFKRPGLELQSDDFKQGRSYARMLDPSPPLVVVTNGAQTQVRSAHSGEEIGYEDISEQRVASLFQAAAAAAQSDIKEAINTLLGANNQLWKDAFDQITQQAIGRMTGSWSDELERPFVETFLIHREITAELSKKIDSEKRLIVVAGAPLLGSSSVLRDLVATNTSRAILFIPAEEGGIFRQLADVLRSALKWPVTPEEARGWLIEISQSSAVPVVLAVDDIGSDDCLSDLKEFASGSFGKNFRVVVACDDAVAHRLLIRGNRKKSALGRDAEQLNVPLLTDVEFRQAHETLKELRVLPLPGAEHSLEYRIPWILRAAVALEVADAAYQNDQIMVSIPPMLGLGLIVLARKRFEDGYLLSLFARCAAAALDATGDIDSATSPITFLLRVETAKEHLSDEELKHLSENGYVRYQLDENNRSVIVIKTPELLASECAKLLSDELARIESPDDQAERLCEVGKTLPFGDIIAAQSIMDLAAEGVLISIDVIRRLIARLPKATASCHRTKIAIQTTKGKFTNYFFDESGRIARCKDVDSRSVITQDEQGRNRRELNEDELHAGLILSYLAFVPSISGTVNLVERVDSEIMLHVGMSQVVVAPPIAREASNCNDFHPDQPYGNIGCMHVGIIEPITFAIMRYIQTENWNTEKWIDEAIEQRSLPLLLRIDAAASLLESITDIKAATFCARIRPRIYQQIVQLRHELHRSMFQAIDEDTRDWTTPTLKRIWNTSSQGARFS